MKILLLAVFVLFICGHIYSQTWQPMGIPEGSGVTDMVYWKGSSPLDDKLWVTTGSVDWPNGQRGGVFYSSGNGVWNRLGGSAGYYVGRTLAVGQDGNLYASLWRNPSTFPADALCRLSVQAATFGILYQAQAGDNIFSIAVKNNPHTIFGGTRNGVIRSTNNGSTFGYSNTGIPDSAWVYDIAIDSSGILAIASSKGVFISTDNGENWQPTTGIAPEDTVVTLEFVGLINDNPTLMAGTLIGHLYKGVLEFGDTPKMLIELQFVPLGNGGQGEVTAISKADEFADLFFYGLFDAIGTAVLSQKINNGSGVYVSSDAGVTWSPINDGLPPSPPVSALALKVINETSSQLYAGLFNDTTNGAAVYKLDITVDVKKEDNQIPSEYNLEQNYPNPFNPSTTIQFSIPEPSFVKLEVFNTLGEKVAILVSEELNAGNYKYDWNAGNIPSGIYYYKLFANEFSKTNKMILLK
jgi:hypothetical protein